MRAARIATAAYLTALLAFCVWRAATQSFSTDEAYSYRLYVGAEPFNLFRQYDANLHLLHTWLCWLSVRVFGLSELAFRLPSLAGAALYFAGVYRLCSLATRSAWMFAVGVALLTVNPLVLDHMVVARGYGLALGFFAWAFAEAVVSVRPRVAVLIALSVASNLVFLFPSAALIAAMAIAHRDWRGVARNAAAPAFVLAFLAWVLPMSLAEPGSFYFGASTLGEMIQPLVEMSLGGRSVEPSAAYGVPLWACLGAAFLCWRKRDDKFAATVGATFALTAAIVMASHFVLKLPLPWGRTGVYLLFLAPLVLFAAGRWAAVPAVALIVAMASGIRGDRFQEWAYDAPLREIVARIEAEHTGLTRVAASGPMETTLEIYRAQRGFDWMEIARLETPSTDADFYVLGAGDRHYAREIGLRVIYQGTAGTWLARKP